MPAATIAGRSSGRVTSRVACHGPAPNVRAAATRSCGSCDHTVPTTRTTTATLKKTCAAMTAVAVPLQALRQQGGERGADHDGRQQERHRDHRDHQATADELPSSHQVGGSQPDRHVATVLIDRLPAREPDHAEPRPGRLSVSTDRRRIGHLGRATSPPATRRTTRGTRPGTAASAGDSHRGRADTTAVVAEPGASPQHDLGPLVDPRLAVGGDVGRRQRERIGRRRRCTS